MWNVAVESAQARLCLSPPVETMGRTIVRKGEGTSAELTQSPVSRFPWRDNKSVWFSHCQCVHSHSGVSSTSVPLTVGTRCQDDSHSIWILNVFLHLTFY